MLSGPAFRYSPLLLGDNRIPFWVQVHIEDVAMAEQLLQQSQRARQQLRDRSYSHCFTALYLYTEGGPLPEVTQHSLSGEALPPMQLPG